MTSAARACRRRASLVDFHSDREHEKNNPSWLRPFNIPRNRAETAGPRRPDGATRRATAPGNSRGDFPDDRRLDSVYRGRLFVSRTHASGQGDPRVSEHPHVATICGIDTQRIRMITFGLAAAMAGTAGVMLV